MAKETTKQTQLQLQSTTKAEWEQESNYDKTNQRDISSSDDDEGSESKDETTQLETTPLLASKPTKDNKDSKLKKHPPEMGPRSNNPEGGAMNKNAKRKTQPQPRLIEGLSPEENRQYIELCRKLAKAIHMNQTIEEAMILDSEPWPFHLATYEQQATAFLESQTAKWQWAITTGKTSEQRVVKHIISKIVPHNLRHMVTVAMKEADTEANNNGHTSHANEKKAQDLKTLKHVVIQAATTFDEVYKTAVAEYMKQRQNQNNLQPPTPNKKKARSEIHNDPSIIIVHISSKVSC